MFEDELESREYHLFISQIPDSAKEYDIFTEKLENAYDFSYLNHSIKGKNSDRELKDQIATSEVVIVLSGQYSQEPNLINNIMSVALNLGKKIVLIRPYGMEDVPPELEKLSNAVVGWNAPCVIDAIKNVLGELEEEESCEIF